MNYGFPKPRPKVKTAKQPKPRKRVKASNPKRRKSEFARCYHSRERVRWVKSQPCVICGRGSCDNAHTVTGGMGRKGNYQTIVPLCCMSWSGHHGKLHDLGIKTFQKVYQVDLAALAAETERRWLAVNAAPTHYPTAETERGWLARGSNKANRRVA